MEGGRDGEGRRDVMGLMGGSESEGQWGRREGGRHTLLQLALLCLILDELLELLLVALGQAVDVEFSVGVHCDLRVFGFFLGRWVGLVWWRCGNWQLSCGL